MLSVDREIPKIQQKFRGFIQWHSVWYSSDVKFKFKGLYDIGKDVIIMALSQ